MTRKDSWEVLRMIAVNAASIIFLGVFRAFCCSKIIPSLPALLMRSVEEYMLQNGRTDGRSAKVGFKSDWLLLSCSYFLIQQKISKVLWCEHGSCRIGVGSLESLGYFCLCIWINFDFPSAQ